MMASLRRIACIVSFPMWMRVDCKLTLAYWIALGAKFRLIYTGQKISSGLISLLSRTEVVARHLTEYLKRTNRFDKTIVFCVDQEHALDMRKALNNLNADLSKIHVHYVARVVSDEQARWARTFG